MEIIVCIKQVPGSNKAEVDPETGVIRRDPLDSKMNPYDLYAIEAALRLKERHGGRVTALTMGPTQAAQILREAYSMGVDEGVLLTDRRFAGSDVLATSGALSQAIGALGRPYDVILCGKQTTDGDTAQVGAEVAEMLGIPSASGVVAIESVEEGPNAAEHGAAIIVRMDMPTTLETVRVRMPCLLCVEKDIYTPRLPSYLKKVATADRPVRTLTLDDLAERDESLYGLDGSPTHVQQVFPPPSGGDREIWEGGGAELADRLYAALVEHKFLSARGEGGVGA